MTKSKDNQAFSQMYLAKALEGEVQAWVDQDWPGVTQTTLELFVTVQGDDRFQTVCAKSSVDLGSNEGTLRPFRDA